MIGLRRDVVVMQMDPGDGGRIVSLVIGGVERILPKARARAHVPALYWGCYPMVPWAGRLSEGRIPTGDGEVRLEPNLPPSSIHGLGFDKTWDIVERSESAVTMTCELRGLGWPFGGRASQTLRVGANSLELELRVGDYAKAGPAGLGWHPWFTRPFGGDLELRVDSSEVLVLDADLVPTGEVRLVAPNEDLRAGSPLGDRRLATSTFGPMVPRSCAGQIWSYESNTTRACRRSSCTRLRKGSVWSLRRCGRTLHCSRRPGCAVRGCGRSSRETR